MSVTEAASDRVAVPVPEPVGVLEGIGLSRLGHDVRSPLGSIISLTALMSRKIANGTTDPAQQLHQLRLLNRSATGLLGFFERFVMLVRLESGEFDFPNVTVDCALIAHQVVADLSPAASGPGRHLKLEVHDGPALAAARRALPS